MRQNDNSSNKTVKVRSIVKALGGSLFVAVVAGLMWHRRDIKRLIEIARM